MTSMTNREAPRRLTPKLGLAGLVFFGVSYMSVTIGLLVFGVLAEASNNTAAGAFVVATVAMLLTALSYARLARRYPSSGSVYTYARRILGSHLGFMAGWALMLDYMFLPMVANFVSALYLSAQFPAVPLWLWMLLIGIVLSAINVVGLKAADAVNKTFVVGALMIVLVVLGFFISGITDTPPASFTAPFWNDAATVSAVSAAAAIAAYSFLGFDAVSTLSEEAKDASRTVPRALIFTVLAGGAIFTVVAYVLQLAIPAVSPEDADVAWYVALGAIAGPGVANVLNLLIVVLGLSSALSVQAGSSRLLFVMGRDGVLPRRLFGQLSRRFETPVFNIILLAAITMVAAFFDLAQATSFINFGAFAAFTVVNVCVIVMTLRDRRLGQGGHLWMGIIVPAIAALVDIYLLLQLDGLAKTLGVIWLAGGVVYLAVLTRGFRQRPPEARFEERSFDDSARTAVVPS